MDENFYNCTKYINTHVRRTHTNKKHIRKRLDGNPWGKRIGVKTRDKI